MAHSGAWETEVQAVKRTEGVTERYVGGRVEGDLGGKGIPHTVRKLFFRVFSPPRLKILIVTTSLKIVITATLTILVGSHNKPVK